LSIHFKTLIEFYRHILLLTLCKAWSCGLIFGFYTFSFWS
jgi:hypothetical protein